MSVGILQRSGDENDMGKERPVKKNGRSVTLGDPTPWGRDEHRAMERGWWQARKGGVESAERSPLRQ